MKSIYEKANSVVLNSSGEVIATCTHRRGGTVSYAYDSSFDALAQKTRLVNTRTGKVSNSAAAWEASKKSDHGSAKNVGDGLLLQG